MTRRSRPKKRAVLTPPRQRSPRRIQKNWFANLPNELVILSAHYMRISTLRSLSMTNRRYHDLLGRGFVYEEEVEDERLFDEARKRFKQLERVNGLTFDNNDILKWPECKLKPKGDPLSKDDYAFLDKCVNRWGKGILWLNASEAKVQFRNDWPRPKVGPRKYKQLVSSDNTLINELLPYMRASCLIFRAIEKCFDMQVIEQIVDAYLLKYLEALQGQKGTRWRVDLAGPKSQFKLCLPPVLWACSRNRVDVLELLQSKYNMEGKRAEDSVDINVVAMDEDTIITTETISLWSEPSPSWPPPVVDAWQAAFYHLDPEGRHSYGSATPGEDVCIWLLNKNLGFSSRPDGIWIDILVEAAKYRMLRLLRALIDRFRGQLTTEEFQSSLTLALQAVAGSRNGRTGDPTWADWTQGHEEVIDMLIGAGTSIPSRKNPNEYLDGGLPGASVLLRQDPDRAEDKGLLARAVTWTPYNAVHLLKLQMTQKLTDYRDLKAALLQTIMWGGETRLEFLKMVFPLNVDLLYSPAERTSPQGRFLAYRNLIQSFIEQMSRCFKTDRYDTALYLVEILGRSRVGVDLTAELQMSKSGVEDHARKVVAGVWAAGRRKYLRYRY
ncbi:hypothetical protein PG985_000140 [Apiospora marii]|uniref:uncharacterized protein n=1 Tax=Apiospora marii TaxID=335849 RepID=UPI00312EC3FF